MEIVVPFGGVLLTGAILALIGIGLFKVFFYFARRAFRRRQIEARINAAALAALEPLIENRKKRWLQMPFRRKESVWVPLRRKRSP
jgi:hypothetical protein